MLKNAVDQCEAERSWAFGNVAVVTAMPKKDFEQETQTTVQTIGHVACDPAIAADGSGLLLLSDDMGLRLWSRGRLWDHGELVAARTDGRKWRGQPVGEEVLRSDQHAGMSEHVYTSLEPGGLMHQARKNVFEVSRNCAAFWMPLALRGQTCMTAVPRITALIEWQAC